MDPVNSRSSVNVLFTIPTATKATVFNRSRRRTAHWLQNWMTLYIKIIVMIAEACMTAMLDYYVEALLLSLDRAGVPISAIMMANRSRPMVIAWRKTETLN